MATPINSGPVDESRWCFRKRERAAGTASEPRDQSFRDALITFHAPHFRALFRAWKEQGDGWSGPLVMRRSRHHGARVSGRPRRRLVRNCRGQPRGRPVRIRFPPIARDPDSPVPSVDVARQPWRGRAKSLTDGKLMSAIVAAIGRRFMPPVPGRFPRGVSIPWHERPHPARGEFAPLLIEGVAHATATTVGERTEKRCGRRPDFAAVTVQRARLADRGAPFRSTRGCATNFATLGPTNFGRVDSCCCPGHHVLNFRAVLGSSSLSASLRPAADPRGGLRALTTPARSSVLRATRWPASPCPDGLDCSV